MKKIFIAVVTLLALLIFNPTADVAIAVGKAPDNITNKAQARILARRAAQIMAIKDNNGKLPQSISETWDENKGEYIIQY